MTSTQDMNSLSDEDEKVAKVKMETSHHEEQEQRTVKIVELTCLL